MMPYQDPDFGKFEPSDYMQKRSLRDEIANEYCKQYANLITDDEKAFLMRISTNRAHRYDPDDREFVAELHIFGFVDTPPTEALVRLTGMGYRLVEIMIKDQE